MSGLLLASRSPRRCELLRQLGLPFDIYAPDVDENCSCPADKAVELLSIRKAFAAAADRPGYYVLSADTLVSVHGAVLGKPVDEQDAIRMLHLLSGRTHQVFTGVTVISPDGRAVTRSDCSEVTFSELNDSDILSYVLSGEPMDKAGGYALQGKAGIWIQRISGSPSSIIGLPLHLVRILLNDIGYPFSDMIWKHH